MINLGLTDAYRVFHREPHRYTFWDYQAGRWNRDEGLRIDHLLLSPHAADRVVACDIDKSPRGKERASDQRQSGVNWPSDLSEVDGRNSDW